jgi:Ribosomal protein S8e
MEANGDQGDLRRRGIHKKTSQDGEIRTTYGFTIQESQRYASSASSLCIPPKCWNKQSLIADLKATFQLQILGVKKNPQSPMYTQLGVMTKGTVIEVNVSELGMVTTGGKVVFGKYAQITNNPENDGCINAVLRASLFFPLPPKKGFLT